MVYILILCILSCLSIYDVMAFNKRVAFNPFLYLLINFLCAFSIFVFVLGRYKTGTDWPAYYDYFYNNTFFWEYGWSHLNSIIYNLGGDAEVLLVTVAFVSLSIKFLVPHRLKIPISTFFLLLLPFIINRDFGTIRQGLAISITFYSFLFLLERKFMVFLMLCFLASLFHQSAIVFVLALPFGLINFDLSKNRIFLFLVISFTFGYLGLVDKLFQFVIYSLGLDSGLFYKLKRYLSYSDEYTTDAFPIVPIIKKVTTIIVLIWCGGLSETFKRNHVFSLSLKLYVMGVFLFIALGDYSQLRRLVGYFEIYEYVCLAIALVSVKHRLSILFLFIFVILSTVSKLWTYLTTYADFLLPYKSILEFIL